MKLLIGSVTKCEEIKQAVLSMDLPLTYQGKKGLQMVFDCASDEDEKIILRKVKDEIEAAAGAWRYLLQCDMWISRQPVTSLYSTRKESTSDELQNHAFLFHTA